MSVIQNNLLLAGDDAYNLTRSLRFRSSASAYLSRTPASAGNRKTWTWSGWVKRGILNAEQDLLSASVGTGSVAREFIGFADSSTGTSADTLTVGFNTTGSSWVFAYTNAVFRDVSAHYHIIVAVDTTQATASNRVKIYVNGLQQTLNSSSAYPSQNTDLIINSANIHQIGRFSASGLSAFDGLMTEINFIDGQALTPSSFGATNAQTGVWQPKKYAGTYGTNGFYLPFTDNSALTSGSNAGLGKDFSGNGNYWNTNNISITSGATYDSMTDVPTLTSATASNFATLNPLQITGTAGITVSNANLTSTFNTNGQNGSMFSTIGMSSGAYYSEFTITTLTGGTPYARFGIALTSSAETWAGSTSASYGYCQDGTKANNGTTTSYGATFTQGDVIGIAFDATNGTLTFYKNGTSQGTAFTGITGEYKFICGAFGNATPSVINANFGQRPFAYTPPTGYVALNTYNLPTPTIGATASTQAGKYFNPVLYTGNGTNNRSITGVGFQPDLVWIKGRSAAWNNFLFDYVRGANKYLVSDLTIAEGSSSVGDEILSAFETDGFKVSANGNSNQNANTYVAWNWKANGAGSTNTAGSITSTVSANTSAGFSVVTYTGNGTAGATIGHGLGVTPRFIIVKQRNGTNSWNCYHADIGNTKAIQLNSTGTPDTSSNYWNNTSPTSSVVTISTNVGVGGYNNANGGTFVAYCFAEVAGYSKFGSYTGNGSSDGTYIHLGFSPKFVMTKRTDTSGYEWEIFDTSRNTYNVTDLSLAANDSRAEVDGGTPYDLLSNGFKARSTSGSYNANGATYIYMAFASVPAKFSLGK